MKLLPFTFFIVIIITSACQKEVTHTCASPEVALQQEGYTFQEWDTIITKVYEDGLGGAFITDTFYAAAIDDLLLVTPNEEKVLDIEIIIPGAGRQHLIEQLLLIPRFERAINGAQVICFDDVRYKLDGEMYTHSNTYLALNYLKR